MPVKMVRGDRDFVVYDAKNGDDLTHAVLTQIIVEEEAKGQNMLPINFLRQLISLYGDNLQFLVPRYLEQSMESFAPWLMQKFWMRTNARQWFGILKEATPMKFNHCRGKQTPV